VRGLKKEVNPLATTNSRTNRRYTSSLSAAREGWHRWAGKHWGWFVPVLASIGVVRGSYRGARRVWRASNRTGLWMNRISVQVLSLHPRSRPAATWLRTVTRTPDTTTVDCAYCGSKVAADRADAHLNAHQAQAQAQAAKAQGRPATPATTSPNVVPIRRPSPRPQPAAAPPRPSSNVPTSPAGTPSSRTGGNTMASTNVGTAETLQLTRAALSLGEMDPKTAWELDAQFQGMARSLFTLSESLGQWIETLDAIKTDPRVTAQAGVAVGEIAEVVRTFTVTRQLYRNLYAAQFAAAEANVRQVQRQNFFNPNAA
jgi:hypothetical protein